jgi:phage-related minor tail protein
MGLSAGTAFVDIQPKIGAGFAGGIASKLGPIGAAGGLALGAGIAAGVGGLAVLKNIGDTFDDSLDTIRVGTGATGDALVALGDNFKSVLTEVPADAESAALAIADLNTRLGAQGPQLESLAAQQLELARITGTDLGTNIEKTTRLLGDWGVGLEDAEGALDLVFRASQATGPPVSRLADLMVQYGAPLRQFGFGMDEAAVLLGKFEKEGVNTELVMGSLRVALGKIAREGGDPASALAETIEAIKNTGSAGEANAMAIELFGARAGPDMAAAIKEGRFELGELFSMVTEGGESIRTAGADTEDYREKWEKLKNRVFVALEPLATRFLEVLGNIFDVVADAAGPIIDTIAGALEGITGLFSGVGSELEGVGGILTTVMEHFRTVFTFISTIIGDIFGGAKDALQANAGGIESILTSLGNIFRSLFEVAKAIFGALQAFWDQWGGVIIAIFSGAIGTVVSVLSGAFQVIEGIFDVVLGILTGDWSRAWDGIKNIFSGVINAIIGIVKNVAKVLTDIWHHLFGNGIIPDMIRAGLDRVIGFFRELPGKIFGFIAGLPGKFVTLAGDIVAGLVSGLGNIASLVGDKIKSGISSAINGVKSFFGIGSPSKVVARELGLPLAQGVALGTEATGNLAGTQLRKGINEAINKARQEGPIDLAAVIRGDLTGINRPTPTASADLTGIGTTGGNLIIEEGGVVVNYPTPEPASISVPRELRRVAADLSR